MRFAVLLSDLDHLPDERLLTTEQAAALLGMSPDTLIKWAKLRRGPPRLKLSRRFARYQAGALRDWLQQVNREAVK
jgi:predicted DNA-binding transcriptional regulator AlpA